MDESRPRRLELGSVGQRQTSQRSLTPRRNAHQDLATVDLARSPRDEVGCDEPIHEAHERVMAKLQAFGENPDGRTHSCR
jgi:hypothetical protein